MTYNEYKNWNTWNVSLWLNNEESLYRTMVECIRSTRNRDEAARVLLTLLPETTPDGARYNKTAIKKAMQGISR